MAQRADLSGAAFGKITAVYGHVDKNEHLSINGLLMAITDKMGKTSRLSVKIQTFRTRFYGQMLQKAAFFRNFA
ncbi:hypothetical protein [Ligilactobacillus ruminis]|uniref:Uncharacterized protein n=1 Tax=Ligilactobacillus ruminis TaxID=1623 RepID=A0A837IX12_9LACO|nr:hypothetical protein [Ligilactobacillus ruminis]KLA47504.1 hypothetical protein LRB_1381 [Ligilactobacillus ruminis]KRM82602.1 hypothetical protein FC25_GL000589 [Ligilactobacillus ruminis DSM 20403 = NBRC 102161]MCF2545151.1 hypothetical protein [Ligilactobacillus ruminis]MCR5748796.1 hypothetical protein [Lactobacillus sp.]